jgi:hypothetical protein
MLSTFRVFLELYTRPCLIQLHLHRQSSAPELTKNFMFSLTLASVSIVTVLNVDLSVVLQPNVTVAGFRKGSSPVPTYNFLNYSA